MFVRDIAAKEPEPANVCQLQHHSGVDILLKHLRIYAAGYHYWRVSTFHLERLKEEWEGHQCISANDVFFQRAQEAPWLIFVQKEKYFFMGTLNTIQLSVAICRFYYIAAAWREYHINVHLWGDSVIPWKRFWRYPRHKPPISDRMLLF